MPAQRAGLPLLLAHPAGFVHPVQDHVQPPRQPAAAPPAGPRPVGPLAALLGKIDSPQIVLAHHLHPHLHSPRHLGRRRIDHPRQPFLAGVGHGHSHQIARLQFAEGQQQRPVAAQLLGLGGLLAAAPLLVLPAQHHRHPPGEAGAAAPARLALRLAEPRR